MSDKRRQRKLIYSLSTHYFAGSRWEPQENVVRWEPKFGRLSLVSQNTLTQFELEANSCPEEGRIVTSLFA